MAVKRILVVEDEPLVAWDIESILADNGFAVIGPVATIDAALGAIAEADIDGAFVDMNLGGQPVDSVADALRSARVPFSFVTGYSAIRAPAGYSAVPIIRKPFDAEALLRTAGWFSRDAEPLEG